MVLQSLTSTISIDTAKRVYALQHLESNEFICVLQNGVDYLACFSDGDSALEFREQLGLNEHVRLFVAPILDCPFRHFWLDGEDMEIRE